MRMTVDRIEEGLVVCQDDKRNMSVWPISVFPPNVKDGDIVLCENGVFTIDRPATDKIRKEINAKFQDLIK